MKVRIRFSKTGALVYIGHLDVMRYFQKLFRRAGIPVKYSEGFSPHQILSFSPPLPLGTESAGEYADVELTDRISTEDAMKALIEQSVDEIEILSFKELPEKCDSAMAAVTAAGYKVTFETAPLDIEEAVRTFLSSEEVLIVKKTKKSEKELNIRSLVYELSADNAKGTVSMLISSGSVDNIKPDLVIGALFKPYGTDCEGNYRIMRTDQYTGEGEFISLDEIGKEIQ
ncbi:MAG: TIGR03936 family radical SAM-associated protein [Lachnospiraceae bacterium]|nr:TIGR03936 family radical SAM-associated protein [Lachnospiraceae bacterium]